MRPVHSVGALNRDHPADAHHEQAQRDGGFESLHRNQHGRAEHTDERANELGAEEKSGVAVVEVPFALEEGQDGTDEGDDDTVDDEASAEQGKD